MDDLTDPAEGIGSSSALVIGVSDFASVVLSGKTVTQRHLHVVQPGGFVTQQLDSAAEG